MDDPNERYGETDVGETIDLLLRTRRFLASLDSGSALHEQLQTLAAELEEKLVRQVGNE